MTNIKDVSALMQEKRHDFSSLVNIMRILRADGGCPWDREQTHESIRANFIEETYEVIEAIDTGDRVLLQEELGDVLLQVIFHARISEEAGEFDVNDVIHDVCAKLIHRHPHIFGDVQTDTAEEVLANWESIKTVEKQRIGLSGTLEAIPPSLPALMRAQKTVKKCAKEDLVPDASCAASALQDAAAVAQGAAQTGDPAALSGALQQILTATALLAQTYHIDAEKLLYDKCEKITASITKMEKEDPDSIAQLSGEDRKAIGEKVFFAE